MCKVTNSSLCIKAFIWNHIVVLRVTKYIFCNFKFELFCRQEINDFNNELFNHFWVGLTNKHPLQHIVDVQYCKPVLLDN